jgi:hypothetical protein
VNLNFHFFSSWAKRRATLHEPVPTVRKIENSFSVDSNYQSGFQNFRQKFGRKRNTWSMSAALARDLPLIEDVSHALISLVGKNPAIGSRINRDLFDLNQRYLLRGGFSPSLAPPGSELPRTAEPIKTFQSRSCPAWREICKRFGPSLTHHELVCLAEVVSHNLSLTLDRVTKRKKKALIKWFDDHLTQISPFLGRVVLIDADGHPVQNIAV